MFKQKGVNLIKKIYPKYGLKDSDIIFASFPKSGNTWLRFIWSNIISQMEMDGKEVDFHLINKGLLDAEYDTHSYGEFEYECLPRLVKTHREYDQRFKDFKKIYLYRHPGDVMVSYYEYNKAQKNSNFLEKGISDFIRDSKFGVPAWQNHVENWLEQADVVIKYEEMKKDAFEVMKKIIDTFDITNIDENIINKAIQKSSFTNMQNIEERKGRPSRDEGKFDKNFRFVRKGSVGDWENRMNPNDVEYIKKKSRNYYN